MGNWKSESIFRSIEFIGFFLILDAIHGGCDPFKIRVLGKMWNLKQELSGTKAYKETSEEEKSVVNGHCNHLALNFSVCVKERQDRLPTMYWLPKLHQKKKKKKKKKNL